MITDKPSIGLVHALKAPQSFARAGLAVFIGVCRLKRVAKSLRIKRYPEKGETAEAAQVACILISLDFCYDGLHPINEVPLPKGTGTSADGNQAAGTSFTAGPVAPSKPKDLKAWISASVDTPSAKTNSPML